MYTALNRDTETFSAIWTEYNTSFLRFYHACLNDIAQHANGVLFPKSDLPPNVFNISSVPWLDFTAFNLNVGLLMLYPVPTKIKGNTYFDFFERKYDSLRVILTVYVTATAA